MNHHYFFHSMICIPRVDLFNKYDYTGKHKIKIPCLIDYGISCVNIYTFDYMHLALLGAVRRLIPF